MDLAPKSFGQIISVVFKLPKYSDSVCTIRSYKSVKKLKNVHTVIFGNQLGSYMVYYDAANKLFVESLLDATLSHQKVIILYNRTHVLILIVAKTFPVYISSILNFCGLYLRSGYIERQLIFQPTQQSTKIIDIFTLLQISTEYVKKMDIFVSQILPNIAPYSFALNQTHVF